MSSSAPATAFLYEASDIPAGVTLDDWRRATDRAAAAADGHGHGLPRLLRRRGRAA